MYFYLEKVKQSFCLNKLEGFEDYEIIIEKSV